MPSWHFRSFLESKKHVILWNNFRWNCIHCQWAFSSLFQTITTKLVWNQRPEKHFVQNFLFKDYELERKNFKSNDDSLSRMKLEANRSVYESCMLRKMWKQTTVWMCAIRKRKPFKCSFESHAYRYRIRNEASEAFVYPAYRGWNELETTTYTHCTLSALQVAWYTLIRHVYDIETQEPVSYSKACHRHQFERESHCVRMYCDFYANW